MKVFLWQLFHKSLLARGTLLKRGLNINASCPICLGDIESIEHLFKDCQMVKKVWDLAAKHQWLPSVFSLIGCHDFHIIWTRYILPTIEKWNRNSHLSCGVFGHL